jgi:cytochrome oxidase assembly protein ShyY1
MMRQHTRLMGWIAALATIALFCFLGHWQLQRMHEKQALLDQQAPARAQALTLAEALAAPPQLRWVVDAGRFLPVALLLDNQMRDGRAGIKVYQPFRSDAGALALVDLGWLPMPPDRTVPTVTLRDDHLRLAGLLAPPPAAGLALGPAMSPTQQTNVWLASRMPPDEVAVALSLPPGSLPARVLRLDPALPGGYARDLELLPNTLPPSRHLGYAVQWFGLALTVLMVALLLEWRRHRRPDGSSSPNRAP